jgi:diguanylate cyclase (GGDEF)-like protein/PAS domain S-box-containing protein
MTISQQAIIFESNSSLNRMLMLDEHVLSHQSFVKFIHNDDRALFEQTRAALFHTGQPQSVHLRLSKGKTDYFWARIEAALAKDLVENLVARVMVIDMSERKQAEQKLIDKEMLLRAIVSAIPDLVWLKDNNGRYLFCNGIFERLYGAPEADIIGKTDYDFVSAELADLFCSYDRKVMLTGKQSVNEECVTFAADRHVAFLETIKTPLRDAQGNLIGILGIARDISDHKKMQEKLQHQAITDELTGIFNRRHFMLRAEAEIHRMRRYGGMGSLLLLDLDGFKQINDVFGHPVGDTVLQSVTEICQQTLRCNDLFGRIGGEEFAILLLETDSELAKQVAERVRENVESAVFFSQCAQALTLSVSIGVAIYNSPDDTLIQLISRAEKALAAAKNAGRNRVVVG